MLSRRVIVFVVSLALVLNVPAFASAASDQVPAAEQSSAKGPDATPQSRSVMGSPSGYGLYPSGSGQATSFNLPLVRIDSYYDTIIHVSNASGNSTTVTVTIRDDGGNLAKTVVQTLGAWATFDDDVGASAGLTTPFQGTATVSSAPAPITVTVDVFNGKETENLDTYAGVQGGSKLTYLAFTPSLTSIVTPTIYVQNTGSNQANVSFSFYNLGGTTVVPYAVMIPPFGAAQVDVSQIAGIKNNNVDSSVRIESDSPLAIVQDLAAPGIFVAAAPETSPTAGTFYVPRFDFTTTDSWNTGIVLLNTDSSPRTFSLSILNPDGTVAQTLNSPSIDSMMIWKVNFAGQNYPNLPPGFVGSAVATSTAGAVLWAMEYQLTPPNIFHGQATYVAPTAPWSGSATYLPALRKRASGTGSGTGMESTSFALRNTQAIAQAYRIVYRDHGGAQVKSQMVILPAFGMWYVSQAADPDLTDGFEGSAQITQLNGGPLPVVEVGLYATDFTPPGSLPIPCPFCVFLPTVRK